MEPISLMILDWFVSQVLVPTCVNVAAPYIERIVVTPSVRQLTGNPSIQGAMSAAWKTACRDIFDAYIDSATYMQLDPSEKERVRAQRDIWASDETSAVVFGSNSFEGSLPQNNDWITELFDQDVTSVTRSLVDGLQDSGLWEPLPGSLQGWMRQNLVASLYERFLDKAIRNNPEVRDELFFEQFLSLRQDVKATREESFIVWSEAIDKLVGLSYRMDEGFDELSDEMASNHAALNERLDRLQQTLQPVLFPLAGKSAYAPLTTGTFAAPSDVGGAMESFLDEYVGTDDTPVPFAGRSAELKELDDWLADAKTPFALLVSPGGRGKSALLARWALAVAREGRAAVGFLPVSLRFNLAQRRSAFPLLGARLRYLLSDGRSQASYPDAEMWLSEISVYLRERRAPELPLLIIVDGADEATDWELGLDLRIPREVDANLKVLVAARPLPHDAPEKWRERLGWDPGQVWRFDLSFLDQEAIIQIIEEQKHRLGGEAADVIAISDELYRLTSGDPILVRLYVEALSSDSRNDSLFQIEDLASIDPGLNAFFEKWWEDLEHQWKETGDPLSNPVAHAALCALASALGPLSRADLVALTDPEGGSGPRLRRALNDLKRLIAGNESSGYTFMHPRLGEFVLNEQLIPEERLVWNARLFDYGRDVVRRLFARQVSAGQISRYVLEHHAADLASVDGGQDDLFQLIGQMWLQAWEVITGTFNGFLDDLARAWSAAEAIGAVVIEEPARAEELARALGMQIRFALINATIRGRAGNIPLELLAQLVENEEWTAIQGIAYAAAMPSDHQKKDALCRLACAERELPVYEALAVAHGIEDERVRVEALACLVSLLGEHASSVVDEILVTIKVISNNDERQRAISAVLPLLPDQALDRVEGLLGSEEDPYFLVESLALIASRHKGSSKVRLLRKALATAEEIQNEGFRSDAMQSIAPLLTPSLISTALEIIRAIGDPYFCAIDLLHVIPVLHVDQQASLAREAVDIAIDIENSQARLGIVISALNWLSPNDQQDVLDELHFEARYGSDLGSRFTATQALARWYAYMERLDEAIAMVEAAENSVLTAPIFVDLAGIVDESVLPQIIEKAVAAIKAVEAPEFQIEQFVELAGNVTERFCASLVAEALDAARAMPFGAARAHWLVRVVPLLALSQKFEVLNEALAAIGPTDKDHAEGVGVLCDIMELIGSDGWNPILLGIRDLLDRVQELANRAYVISELMPYVQDQAERLSYIEEALSILDLTFEQAQVTEVDNPLRWSIELSAWERERADVVIALSSFMTSDQLQRALAFARSIDYPSMRAELLVKLAQVSSVEDRALVIQEVLAMVASIDSAFAVGEIFGQLVQPAGAESLPLIWTAATTLQDPAARARALCGLLVTLAPEEKQATESAALESAAEIAIPEERLAVLRELIPLLGEDLLESACSLAAEAGADLKNPIDGMYRLSEIAALMGDGCRETLMAQAVELVCGLQPQIARSSGLSTLVCRLMEFGLSKEACSLVSEIDDSALRAHAELCIIAYDPERFDVDEALTVAASEYHPVGRAEMYVTIAEHSPPDRRSEVLSQALKAALEITKTRDRHFVLSLLAPHWQTLDLGELYAVWSDGMRRLATSGRERFLADVDLWLPVVQRLGGPIAMQALADAVAETDDWLLAPLTSGLPTLSREIEGTTRLM